MRNNKKILQSTESKILFVALILVCIFWYVSPDSASKKQLKQKDKESAHKIDSIARLYEGAMKQVEILKKQKDQAHEETNTAIQERDIAQQQKRIAQKKYESIRIKLHTDEQYDSVLTALFPNR